MSAHLSVVAVWQSGSTEHKSMPGLPDDTPRVLWLAVWKQKYPLGGTVMVYMEIKKDFVRKLESLVHYTFLIASDITARTFQFTVHLKKKTRSNSNALRKYDSG